MERDSFYLGACGVAPPSPSSAPRCMPRPLIRGLDSACLAQRLRRRLTLMPASPGW